MTSKDKRLLKKFIFSLYITPYVKVNLIYLAYKYYYLSNYLGISSILNDHIPNEIDREIVKPYLDAVTKLNKTDFITIYVAVCRVFYKKGHN